MTGNTKPQLTSSQRMLLALKEARAQLETVERSQREPIAIVGMGCRFAQANTPEAFWQLLENGVDAVTDVPNERWDIETYYDADPDAPGKTYSRSGSFIDQVDQFDPAFFGISPREATAMDPQQRLLLEVSWEALERSGWVPDRQDCSKTGVFIGITTNDYARLATPKGSLDNINAHYLAGNPLNAVAGRLSYTLGLQGPSMAIDTACSSSLVSVHLACQSLRQKECDAALAGGVNLILTPENTIALSKAHMLSADGRCKTFDAGADGIVRGEGCGVIVLKRLSDATAAGDNILGLIRGSAVNQDGPSSSFTVPNSTAQQALIRAALASAKLSADAVDYVEAHGTGTSLGDPIEVRSLGLVLGQARSQDNPLYIGSVKTNLGHLESAAGIAGLIKLVLSLQHEVIPPHLHFRQPNPHVDWSSLPIEVAAAGRPWPRGEKLRIGGVSSFGASGTNAHVLVEEAPLVETVESSTTHPIQCLPLSAQSEDALKVLATNYVDYLETYPDVALEAVCYTAQIGRRHFPYRVAIAVNSVADAREQLAHFQQDGLEGDLVAGKVAATLKSPKVAFLFTGQGSQYADMGRELFETCSVFRETLEECDRILRPYLDTPLLEVLYGKATHLLAQTAYTQPALFSLEYALAQLWQHWGITPAALIGHSVGEFVAACVAGVFSLEDGLKLIAHRGRLMQALPSNGAMLAALASVDQIQPYLDSADGVLTLAGHNGPSSVVLSGETEAIKALEAELSKADIKTKRLVVSHAFHSLLMEPMVAEFRKVAESITYSAPQLSLVSNLTGQVVDRDMTADYWCEHILKPVRFAEGMVTLSQLNPAALVEIGPHPVLLGMGRSCVPSDWAAQVGWLPSLRRGQSSDWAMMLKAVGSLYVRGVAPNWQTLSGGPQQRLVLPTYPFQRQRYWVEPTVGDADGVDINRKTDLTPLLQLLHEGNTVELNKHVVNSIALSKQQKQLLPDLLQALAQLQQQQSQVTQLQNWCYEEQWQAATPALKDVSKAPQHWLILADSQGFGARLKDYLESKGNICTSIHSNSSGITVNGNTRCIDPSQPEAFEQLFKSLNTGTKPIQRIVYCWGLDLPSTKTITNATLARSQSVGCGGLLHLLQALFKESTAQSPQLWVLTQGAVVADQSIPQLAQVPLWGMGRVIALEYPEIWGGLLDLDPNFDFRKDAYLEQVTNVLMQTEQGQQLALRGNQLLKAKLVRQSAVVSGGNQATFVSAQGTYLITGGLGALGLSVAQGLVDSGAKSLVLLGRSSPSVHARTTIEKWQKAGLKVEVMPADVADLKQLEQTIAWINQELLPLRGIVHAAGVIEDGMLLNQTWQQFENVFHPKLQGTWNLHTLTQGMALDFFVCFSSAVALLGAPGQGNYAAANLFLNALMQYRQAAGLPGLSINWGPWQQQGMAAKLAARFTHQGIQMISPEQGVLAFLHLLGRSVSHSLVLPIDWSTFSQFREVQYASELWAELLPESLRIQKTTEPQAMPIQPLFQELLRTSSKERILRLIVLIKTEVSQVLGLDDPDSLEIDQGFADMGMDSLMAMELKTRLEKILGLSLATTVVFNYPNAEALGIYLSEQIGKGESDTNGWTDDSDVLMSVEDIQKLSEQDVISLIAEEFAALN